MLKEGVVGLLTSTKCPCCNAVFFDESKGGIVSRTACHGASTWYVASTSIDIQKSSLLGALSKFVSSSLAPISARFIVVDEPRQRIDIRIPIRRVDKRLDTRCPFQNGIQLVSHLTTSAANVQMCHGAPTDAYVCSQTYRYIHMM